MTDFRQLGSARRIKPSLRRANKGETATTIRTSYFVEMQPGKMKCNQEKGVLPVCRFPQLYPIIH